MFTEFRDFKFWGTLSVISKLQIIFGIFFTIATLGFLLDIFEVPEIPPLWITLLKVVLFGGYAILSIGLGLKKRMFSFFTIPGFVLLINLIGEIPYQPIPEKMLYTRIQIDGIAAFISLLIGYSLFIRFISVEGHKKLKLQVEIDLAQEMQKILVPHVSEKKKRIEIEGISIPIKEVGGDLIDVIHTRESTTCVIADVSGHGVAAGLVMGVFKSAVRILLQKDIPLEELINRVNEVLFDLKKKSMFITAAILRIKKDNTAQFCIAGHLPILHIGCNGGIIERLGMKQMGLGILPSYKFRTDSIKIKEDDLFVLLTDGLPEVQNKDGIMLGETVIENTIRENADKPLNEIKETIIKTAELHGIAHDDQTLLLLRCK